MKTPYFLISEEKLQENIAAFQKALSELWLNSELAYSVKTNSLPWLLRYLKQYNVSAEVVSDEEYKLAKLCGYDDRQIVFNGPIKGKKQFKAAVENGSKVNLDSRNDLVYLRNCCVNGKENIGIRVNVDPSVFEQEDIGYEADGFRFGFAVENGEFKKALDIVKEICGEDVKIGLHLHCNSITRSINVYKAIAQYTVELVHKYDLKLSYIDIGGGYFGGIAGKPTPYEYISVIKNELIKAVNPKETKLIVEPGSAIIGSVVDLYTSVLDVKDTNRARIVTTDGSRIHIDPLWAKHRYMYSVESEIADKIIKKQVVCGYTCMDHDRLMTLENERELNVGDRIIYRRVGAYSMTFGGPFIRYFPEVFVEHKNGETEKVRSRISTECYLDLHDNR